MEHTHKNICADSAIHRSENVAPLAPLPCRTVEEVLGQAFQMVQHEPPSLPDAEQERVGMIAANGVPLALAEAAAYLFHHEPPARINPKGWLMLLNMIGLVIDKQSTTIKDASL